MVGEDFHTWGVIHGGEDVSGLDVYWEKNPWWKDSHGEGWYL